MNKKSTNRVHHRRLIDYTIVASSINNKRLRPVDHRLASIVQQAPLSVVASLKNRWRIGNPGNMNSNSQNHAPTASSQDVGDIRQSILVQEKKKVDEHHGFRKYVGGLQPLFKNYEVYLHALSAYI
ncbi:unnamed protein product [Lactuca virosa]|uniref:Uncharacterized protein n=1 Tax=Lactuca virosa TaxID=75947 RepID=A0AAU9NHK8_9ASTR|nr:unnamed protein product [Lactuca virosa]